MAISDGTLQVENSKMLGGNFNIDLNNITNDDLTSERSYVVKVG